MTALRRCRTIASFTAFGALIFCGRANPATAAPLALRFTVEQKLLANLGSEHVANATHVRTPNGTAIIGWGDRVVTWRLSATPMFEEAVPRTAGVSYSNGGCALDVTGDGRDDLVVARGRSRVPQDPELVWIEQTANGHWKPHAIGPLAPGAMSPHDIAQIVFRINDRASIRGVVVVLGRRTVLWFQVPDDPAQPWTRHEVAHLPEPNQSGLAVGDVAGRGRPDLVCGMYWLECPSDPVRGRWTVRRFGHWRPESRGSMAKLQLADLDGDGRIEIIATQAEIPGSTLGIFSRDPKNPDGLWQFREIDHSLYCPHSLVSADLDGDGRVDILVGEMSAGGWNYPLNPNPRIMVYRNGGDGRWARMVLVEGSGVHEMGLLPREVGQAAALYSAEETQTQKFPEMKTHVNLWIINPRANHH